MLHEAIGDVHDMMRAKLEQAELGRAQTAADGQPSALAKAGHLPGNHGHGWQPMPRGKFIQGLLGGFCNARFAKARTAGAGRAMSADHVP